MLLGSMLETQKIILLPEVVCLLEVKELGLAILEQPELMLIEGVGLTTTRHCLSMVRGRNGRPLDLFDRS